MVLSGGEAERWVFVGPVDLNVASEAQPIGALLSACWSIRLQLLPWGVSRLVLRRTSFSGLSLQDNRRKSQPSLFSGRFEPADDLF